MENNFKEKDRVIGYEFVMEFVGCSSAKACELIKNSNRLAQEDGKVIFMSGKTTLKYFYKAIGICTEVY